MVRDGLRGASRAERDAAKAGLRSAIDEKLANVNAVASDPNIDVREFQKMANELRSRAMRDNMESLLGAPTATRLYKQLDEQVVSLELRAAVARNSGTARRQAIQGQVEDITAPGVIATLLGDGPTAGPINASKRLVAALAGNTSEARALRQMGIYDEIAGVLVNTRGPQAQRALRLVERAMAGDALSEAEARTIARAVTTPAAMATYAATARPETESRQAQPYLPPAPAPAPMPAPPPQTRAQPRTAPTRGVPAMEQVGAAPADGLAAGPAGGQPNTQSRQMLQEMYPFDDILRLG
jgi:hypothetical protein